MIMKRKLFIIIGVTLILFCGILAVSSSQTTIEDDNGNELPIVNFKYKLAHPCKEEIYNYFMDKLDEEKSN